MKKGKMAVAALAATLILSVSAVPTIPASASSYPICDVENCNRTVDHKHNRVWYCGHSIDDGHDYHVQCTLDNCMRTNAHKHNGHSYLGHHSGSNGCGNHGRRHH